MLYEVQYKDKTYRYQADDAMDAFDIFSERKAFGRAFIQNGRLIAVDKETKGYLWALYAVPGDRPTCVKIKLAERKKV